VLCVDPVAASWDFAGSVWRILFLDCAVRLGRPFPENECFRFHSSLVFRLFRVRSLVNSRSVFRSSTCSGFQPFCAAMTSASTSVRGSHLSLRSVLRLSQPLDGLLRISSLWAYCIPQPRLGFHAVQGVLAKCRGHTSSVALAPLPLLRRRSPADAGCHIDAPRLRGFDPHSVALSRIEMNRSVPRSPHRVPVSSRFFPRQRLLFTRNHPLMTFIDSGLRVSADPHRPPSAFYQRGNWFIRLRTMPTCSTLCGLPKNG
jgi:hypothetical protein